MTIVPVGATLLFFDSGIARRICHLTKHQSWPEKPADGVFVTTGEVSALTSLLPALFALGLTQTASL